MDSVFKSFRDHVGGSSSPKREETGVPNEEEEDLERNPSSKRSSHSPSPYSPPSPNINEFKYEIPPLVGSSSDGTSANEQFEIEALRRQVEAYKLSYQILQQSRSELESKYESLLSKYIELKDSLSPSASLDVPKKSLVCRHYLKGRCRYKSNCKFSHELFECPYCGISLSSNADLAGLHLSACYSVQ